MKSNTKKFWSMIAGTALCAGSVFLPLQPVMAEEAPAAEAEAPQTAAEWQEQGDTFFQGWYYDEAIDAYGHAIALDKQNADAYAARALAFYCKGNTELSVDKTTGGNTYYARAIADYGQALKLAPQEEKYLLGRGIVYLKLEDADKALADFNSVVAQRPDDYSAYDQRSQAYRELKQYDKAILDLNQALALNDKDYMNNYYRGRVYEDQGDYANADASYDKAIAKDQRFAEAWFHKGIVNEKWGKSSEAIDAYRQFLRYDRVHNPDMTAFAVNHSAELYKPLKK